MNYEFILVDEQAQPHIALIRLNRPKELNALNLQLMLELKSALQSLDQNDAVRCIEVLFQKIYHLPLIRTKLQD